MRTLVVDDSATFRTQIRKALEGVDGIEIAGSASNGRIALDMIRQRKIQLVILDLNMPEMDGLATLAELKKEKINVTVIVFAAAGARSAQITLEALRAGASDFVVKPNGTTHSIEDAFRQVAEALVPKVVQFIEDGKSTTRHQKPVVAIPAGGPAASGILSPRPMDSQNSTSRRPLPKAVVVASSTGGPAALEELFAEFRQPAVPVFIAQHMPELFTRFLAKRLTQITAASFKEGRNGEIAKPGTVYIAPGDRHMRVSRVDGTPTILIDKSPRVNNVRPAADLLFESVVTAYGQEVSAFVLTGMGEDGRDGCRKVHHAGGQIYIQDRTSSVVWGMPGAVFHDGTHREVCDLKGLAKIMTQLTGGEQ